MALTIIYFCCFIFVGTADWHYLRKFSLTSSQAHKAFTLAFPAYKTNESWIAVAKYLYGDNEWKQKLNVVDDDPGVGVGVGAGAGANANVDEAVNDLLVDAGGVATIYGYLSQIVPNEGDVPTYDALNFAKKFVGSAIPDEESDDESGEEEERADELVVENDAEAKKILYDELNAAGRKRLLELLSEHVEQQYRKSPTIKDQVSI